MRGEKIIAFIEKYCLTPAGDGVGRPIKLEPFQKRFILEVYDNPHRTRRAYLSIARKNGKTALIAGIVLAHVVGPEARLNTQIASGAQSLEQAALLYDFIEKMVQLSPTLARNVRLIPSKKIALGLRCNVQYRALSADGKRAHGRGPSLAILDEIGQVEGPRSKFISAITTSQSSYNDALLIAISTQAQSDSDLFSIWLDAQANAPDPRIVSHIYSAPNLECKLDDRAAWYAANPALGIFKSLSTFEQDAKTATTMPASEAEFRNLELNQRVEVTTPFVPRSVWQANGEEPTPIEGRKVFGGLDLSAVSDLTSLELLDAEDGSVNSTFWLPEVGLREKAEHDLVPYDLWKSQGLLLTTPGKAIEYEHIANHLRAVFDSCEVLALGFDRYNMKFLKPWLVKAGFSEDELARFIEFGQGTASMTPALRALEVRLTNGTLRHGNHPILNMCSNNVRVTGSSGARKFDKERSRGRIDGMVALAMAVGVSESSEAEVGPSVYETRGALFF